MVRKYGIELDELKHPLMVEEESYTYNNCKLSSPEKITEMLNQCFHLGRKSEEYVYMLALDSKCNLLGAFEVAHGTISKCLLSSREIYQRALLCGAVNIILAHNHPSKCTSPSKEDFMTAEKIKKAGKLIGINMVDFIIIGGNNFLSFGDEKLL